VIGELVIRPAMAVTEALAGARLEVKVAVAIPSLVSEFGVMDPAVVLKATGVPSGTGNPVLSFTRALIVVVDVPLATMEVLLALNATDEITIGVNSTVWVRAGVAP